MKQLFFLVLFPIIFFGQQSRSVSFASTCTTILENKNAFNASVFLSDKNEIQFSTYEGGIIWKNNINEVCAENDSIDFKGFSRIYKTSDKSVSWLISDSRVDIYKNNTRIKTKKIRFGSQSTTYFKSNSLYFVDNENGFIGRFNGNKVAVLKKLTQKVLNSQVFFNRKEQTHYLVLFFENNFIVFSEKNNVVHQIASIDSKYFFDLEMIYIDSSKLFYFAVPNSPKYLDLVEYDNKKLKNTAKIPYHTRFHGNLLFIKKDFGIYDLTEIKNHKLNFKVSLKINDGVRNFVFDPVTNSIIIGTNNKPIQSFLDLKTYPYLFNNLNSSSIFGLNEDNEGRIFASTYQGGLSIIDKNKIVEKKIDNFFPINGGFKIADKMYIFDLNSVFEIDKNLKTSVFLKDTRCYYSLVSKMKQRVYLALSAKKEIIYADINAVYNGVPKWKSINKASGIKLIKALTMTEDPLGRIWFGNPADGLNIYDENTNKVQILNLKNKNISGPICSVTDKYGRLWFGGKNSNLYYFDGNKKVISIHDMVQIKHPLLDSKNRIMSMAICENWLILGAYDRLLLFDIEAFNKNKKNVFIRYLNPTEANFTSFMEENTMLAARDSTLWFSTSDNLYQWDINKWLALPTFKVVPNIIIKKDSVKTEYSQNKCIVFKATENSFNIQLNYQTKDNLPRYLNGVLVKKSEKPIFESPNLQTNFQFSNVASGEYIFYVRVCQQDGSFNIFEYPITINKFLWQNWWFWLLLSFPPIGFILYYFQKKNEIEKQKKKLSQLNLSSLSNQFRPHFMLNALNSIGSQMEDKPHAEKVISRLGESITILYGFTQKNEFTHPFRNEWKLVENVIEIQRLLFIPDLNATIKGVELIDENYKIPVGLIQIPVENALLHGLRNKETKPYNLDITFLENQDNYLISISDNGVGREKAAEMNNFKKNGNGLKTVFEMIHIINQHQANAIKFSLTDVENHSGTRVVIELKKVIDYDKIKL